MTKRTRVRALIVGLVLAALAVTAWGAAALAQDSSPAASRAKTQNIVDTAVGAGKFKTLVSLVKQAGLAETLSTAGPYTVFAPTDAAFAKVPKKTLSALAADPTKLKAVLLYHVANGKVTAAQVVKRKSITTLNGAAVKVKVTGRTVKVDRARVVTPDIAASNGVIHAINRVLIPPAS
jgi:uncharacterized surface protein with fasciclin (FAS1) repeats